MRLTRRGWLAGAALAGAPALSLGTGAVAEDRRTASRPGAVEIPARPARNVSILSRGSGRTDYGPAIAALQTYAMVELEAVGLPGMTISVADDEGFVALAPLGWADVENRAPMRGDHLVQIGSISKSFLALTLLSLADAGKVDLDSPVSRYLPEAALPRQPITFAQILSHTAGLPDGAPLFPRTPDGRLWCGFQPTTSFSYSNTGYELLGALVEAITGGRVGAVNAQGLKIVHGAGGFSPTISQRERSAQAVGYWPWNRWGAETPGMALERATFDPEDTAAGCIAADATAMSGYLRTLIHLGRGQGGDIVSDASARRFVASAGATKDAFGPGARYGFGVAIVPVDGKDVLHHTGGMMSFSSSFHVDPAAGVGCFASVNARNGEYRPRLTTAFAVRLMRAAKAGAPLPAAPDPRDWAVANPDLYVGTFSAGDRTLVVTSNATGLNVSSDGAEGRLFATAPDRLVTDHPHLTRYGFDVVREGGRVAGLWWRETDFRTVGAPTAPATDESLRAYAGTYLNRDPWVGSADVHVRGSRLWLEGGGPLVNRGDFWTLEKDPGGVERFRFEATLNGRYQRLSASGRDLLRVTA